MTKSVESKLIHLQILPLNYLIQVFLYKLFSQALLSKVNISQKGLKA